MKSPQEIAEEIVREWYGGGELILGDCQGLIDGIAQAIEQDRAERFVLPSDEELDRIAERIYGLQRSDWGKYDFYAFEGLKKEFLAALANRRTISEETLSKVEEMVKRAKNASNSFQRATKQGAEIDQYLEQALDLLKGSTDAEGAE